MTLKMNRDYLPIKAHYFLFFAALGPILPQINVFGRQLGVSPGVMGMVTGVLPLLWAAAKPSFGYIVDYFTNQRKLIFMSLIALMTTSHCCLWFLPAPTRTNESILEHIYNLNSTVFLRNVTSTVPNLNNYRCHWNTHVGKEFELWLPESSFISTLYAREVDSCEMLNMNTYSSIDGLICEPKNQSFLICKEHNIDWNNTILDVLVNNTKFNIDNGVTDFQANDVKSAINNENIDKNKITNETSHKVVAGVNGGVKAGEKEEDEGSFYSSSTFWFYVVFMCVGAVSFNVANCIGDAVCFDVLGPEHGNKYGYQRAWGTAGYGITALLGGWLIDIISNGHIKDFTPAFILAIVFTASDMIACRSLKLPKLSSPSDSGKALKTILKMPRVVVFIIFSMIIGIFDSFIIYYMFWYLEELAESTGHMNNIKLIEGTIVAAQSFGELFFFFFSGKILKRWGHGATMTFCLFCYGVRLAVISFISHPWHFVFIETIMQGPTYALCYATIVGYAAEVAPEGYSATVQGIVAGMDDGIGFSLGSLLGGVLYSYLGGCNSFRLMALIGLLAAFVHALLFRIISHKPVQDIDLDDKLTIPEVEIMLQDDDNIIYKDTVLPVK